MRDEAIAMRRGTLRSVAFTTIGIVSLLTAGSLVVQQRERIGSALGGAGIATALDESRYQAVFLAGGQVFFGRLRASGDVFLLTDVYYFGAPPSATPSGEPGPLVKRGNEVFGPSEPMIIPREQIAFVENVKDDSQVAQAIRRFRSGEGTAAPRSATPTPTATR